MAVKRYTISDIHVGGLVDKKFVLEDDHAALEGQLNLMSKSREAWKENATALEKERDALQAECERLREENEQIKRDLTLKEVELDDLYRQQAYSGSRHEAE